MSETLIGLFWAAKGLLMESRIAYYKIIEKFTRTNQFSFVYTGKILKIFTEILTEINVINDGDLFNISKE